MGVSRSKVDKAGKILSDDKREYDELSLELDYVFEEYRKDHLGPLTFLTLELQKWLHSYGGEYYKRSALSVSLKFLENYAD